MAVARVVFVFVLAALGALSAGNLALRSTSRDRVVDVLREREPDVDAPANESGGPKEDLLWAYAAVQDLDGDVEVFDALADHVELSGADVSVEAIDAFYFLARDDPDERERFLDVAVELATRRHLEASASLATLSRLGDLWPESEPVYVLLLADDDPAVRRRVLHHLPAPPDGLTVGPGSDLIYGLAMVAEDSDEAPVLRARALRHLDELDHDGMAREAAELITTEAFMDPQDGWEALMAEAEVVLGPATGDGP